MRLSRNVAVPAAMVAAVALVVVALLVLSRTGGSDEQAAGTTSSDGATGPQVVREDSHRLSTAPDGKVTFVEFLDFECEGCRAAYPAVEQLRKEYDGRVTFIARYFPLPGHKNGVPAAIAVEAAAQQGKFEAMYHKMYETQPEWGESQDSKAAVFRGFAEELGLDLAAFDKAVADPATAARVAKDHAEGEALGVQSTPTFFLNGEKITPESLADLKAELDAALNA